MLSLTFGHRTVACAFVASVLSVSLTACGGGGSGSGSEPASSGSFSISASPATQTLDLGASGTVNLSVKAQGGFNQPISVSLSGLPQGVTSTPASPFTISLAGQQVSLAASSTAALGQTTLNFSASSGELASTAQVMLAIGPAPPGLPNNRTSFVRTDDTPLAVVYDAAHQLIFSSALHLNCVDVISAVTQQLTTCVPVPAPMGLSFSADGSQLIVGTQVGKVAFINTSTLQVAQLATVPPLPQMPGFAEGFNYPMPMNAFQAANGKIFLFSFFGMPAVFPLFTPSATVGEWDPATDSTKARPDAPSGDAVSISADHSTILVAGNGSAGVYNSATDQFTMLSNLGNEFGTLNPSGSQFAILGGTPLVRFFNSQGQQVGSTNVSDCCGPNSTQPAATYSPDGKSLYVAYVAQSTGLPKLITIDTASFQVLGGAANLSTETAGFGVVTAGSPQSADSTGLVLEMADHGVGIVDATSFQSFQNPQLVANFIVATPDEGPLGQTTTTAFTTGIFSSVPDVFFGNQRGLNPVLSGPGQLQASAPPFPTIGPVNVKAVEANGVMAFMPQAFTYGALPIQFGDLASDPKGGPLADLFGYGYSVDIPSADIAVSIGAASAKLQSKDLFNSEQNYPFPLQHLGVSVPGGFPGRQDITVTSPTGSAKSSKAFHYVNSVTNFASADTLLYPLLDPHRNQLYLSAVDHIDVFSLSSNSFATPITVPSNSGNRLIVGLALTPDGSKLLAANQSDQSIAILNPDSPSQGAVAVSVPPAPLTGNPGPFEIATTSTNQAFVTVTTNGVITGCCTPIFSVDLSSHQVTTPALPAGSIVSLTANFIAGSADGSVVIEASGDDSGGPMLSWTAATNTWSLHLVEFQFWNGAAISADGNVLAVSSDPAFSNFPFPYLLDQALDLTAQLNFPEFQGIVEGPTIELDQSGALLYAVNGLGVDILDARTGQLRERVLLNEPFASGSSPSSNPSKFMTINPTGNEMFLLTTAGLTVVQLDSVPLGIGSVTPSSGAAGSVVTVRGSGFVAGTAVSVGELNADVSFVDPSTLKVTVPGTVQQGPVQIALTNPDGSKFSLDAALKVQ